MYNSEIKKIINLEVIMDYSAAPGLTGTLPAVKTGVKRKLNIAELFTVKSLRVLKPYMFLLPALLILGFWLYKPLINTFYYSFTKWTMLPGTKPEPVGFANYLKLFGSKDFGTAVKNTGFYIVMLLPFSVVIPLILANVTNSMKGRMKNVYRALFFFPMIMAGVSTATIFRWLLNPGTGLVNILLNKTGIIDGSISFFTQEETAKWAILLITGWKMIGFSTVIFSAALTGTDKSYYEAASLDGSRKIRKFFDFTVPLISPTILFMVMMSILFASQWTFAYIDILTNGGPYGTSTNIYYEMYKYGFSSMNVGMSSAAANLFLAVFGVIAAVLTTVSKKLAFYDN
jgi:multiple sugar transport system permease protein